MTLDMKTEEEGKILRVRCTSKLSKDDYHRFTPMVEELMDQHGKIRILLELHDFHGWTAGALWEDLKFDMKHFSDIERLAIVGETQWERGMAVFCKPFTSAKIRFFEQADRADAIEWLKQ